MNIPTPADLATIRESAPGVARVVVLCAKQDRELLRQLEKHLTVLEKDRKIQTWHEYMIAPGATRDAEVASQLQSAEIVLLLVSANFFSCQQFEIFRSRDAATTPRIIPLILRDCDWKSTFLGSLQPLPTDGRPIVNWTNRDDAWSAVVSQFRSILKAEPHPESHRAEPIPAYPNELTRNLSLQLDNAFQRRDHLRTLGADVSEADEEILRLRRQIREGGQLRPGDSLANGRYLLLDRLGVGGFAVVWRAFDRQTKSYVAIKSLHSELAGDATRRERFVRGARRMRDLGESGVVRVFEPAGEDGGYHYIVMELVLGGDLRTAVLEGTIKSHDIVSVILEVASTLARAHSRGVIHRDVKPANILLTESGRPKLTDFDLVGAVDTTGGTRTGALGTFLYAAPESMERPQDADARADVYGLGMTTIFAFYGKDLPAKLLYRNPDSFIHELQCDANLKPVLKRAIHWEPEMRYSGALEFSRALRDPNNSAAEATEVLRTPVVPSHWQTRLTAREVEVVQYILRGWDNRLIAEHLGCALATVKKHVARIFDKLSVTSRAALLASFRST